MGIITMTYTVTATYEMKQRFELKFERESRSYTAFDLKMPINLNRH